MQKNKIKQFELEMTIKNYSQKFGIKNNNRA